MVGQIITNANDGLKTKLIGIIVEANYVRRSVFGGNVWWIVCLLSNGKLINLIITDSMLKIL